MHGMFGAAIGLACVGLLWACTGGSDESAALFVPAPEALRASRYIIVQPGQSVTRIAQAYHVPAQAIIAANHLTPPYKLKVGGRLEVPLPGVERWREIVQEELRVFQTPATFRARPPHTTIEGLPSEVISLDDQSLLDAAPAAMRSDGAGSTGGTASPSISSLSGEARESTPGANIMSYEPGLPTLSLLSLPDLTPNYSENSSTTAAAPISTEAPSPWIMMGALMVIAAGLWFMVLR